MSLPESDLGGKFLPLQCEVTYINHIKLSADDLVTGPLGHVVRDVSPRSGEFLPAPEAAGYRAQYIITIEGNVPAGRLHLSIDPARAIASDEAIVLINLTARGRPFGEGIEGVLAFSDLGRNWVVRGFKDLTSPEMHQRWRIKESG